MRRSYIPFLAIFAFLLQGCSSQPPKALESDPNLDPHWKLVFNDEFNGSEVDPEKWVVFLFYSHPPLGQRIEKAQHWY